MVDLVDFKSSHKDDGKDRDDINLSEDDDEEFVYPAAPPPMTDVYDTASSGDLPGSKGDFKNVLENAEVEPFNVANDASSRTGFTLLHDAASRGDLPDLKTKFKNVLESEEVEPFNLANDASSRTGFTLLHIAASRGHYDMVVWLIEDCGAMPDLEDREGETALYKAALNGHMSIVSYLVPGKVDVHARDADGWTALHNASSKGYLDIVQWLCEEGGAASTTDSDTGRGIDIRSKVGWTPLMNASSKGHLAVVLYLLTKQNADPLIRNKWGETAYDVAAAVFEVWICEILQNAEAERWRGVTTLYNPLLVHTTIPLILYENQRLDGRLKAATVSGGRPKISAAGLGRRSPFELKLPTVDDKTGARFLPASRSGVQLPLREASWILPRPETVDHPAPDGVERSHFWLSDWTLDFTHPAVDAEGWQYAQSFDDPDEKWTAEMPVQLKRITSSSSISSGVSGPPGRPQLQWVRRRRWVRIMRRRLDIPPSPFLEPDGAMYHLDLDGYLIPYVEESYNNSPDPGEGQELGTMSSTFLASAQDYVSRARYLVGVHVWDADEGSSIEIRRAIAKLERATTELRQGILKDDETERKTQAEVLLNTYSRDLERRRLSAGARGLLLSDADDYQEADDASSDEFHYPQSSTPRSSGSTDHLSRTGTSRVPVDLTPHLTQAPDFRVPTREAPQNVSSSRRTPPRPQWERDETVQQCRDCRRRFNLLNRRHCRKCGKIFCDGCSSYKMMLVPADVVHDPTLIEVTSPFTLRRVCQSCYEETNGVAHKSLNVMEGIVVDQERFTTIPGSVLDQLLTH